MKASSFSEQFLPSITSGEPFVIPRLRGHGTLKKHGGLVIHTTPRTREHDRWAGDGHAKIPPGRLRGIAHLDQIIETVDAHTGTIPHGEWHHDGLVATINESRYDELGVDPARHVLWLLTPCVLFAEPIPWPGGHTTRWDVPVDTICPECRAPVVRPDRAGPVDPEHTWDHLTTTTWTELRDASQAT